jgi:RHH-type proline utilization regulon transcriptional repressor/proline dehydrogenase/delta 1-pyrroline-5-carboxylate dehydrogenase
MRWFTPCLRCAISSAVSISLIIDGKSCDSRATLVSRNPSKTSEIIGRVASATVDQATDAIEAARRAFRMWAATPVETRAEYLELIAAEIRERRFELTAWIIFRNWKAVGRS